ncbi:MAG: hypothetical protein E7421_08120 [Ruminococcaceae bacterium]|nr:hypothetical protein [Oscillospiraceae bacterium]
MEQKVLRVGTFAITCALALRLLSAAVLDKTFRVALPPEIASCMVFLQTGRFIRPSNIIFSVQPMQPPPTDATEPSEPAEISLPVFSPEDAAALKITSSFPYSADLPALLTKPLTWDLTEASPTVLIVHTHATESFSNTAEYEETTAYHTLDTQYNMVSVGTYVASLLEDNGVSVIHDTTLHDNPSYNASYTNSRRSVQQYLQEYPSIQLVLDLHRDTYEDEHGNQLVHTVFAQDTTYAPLMLVVGTDYSGLEHPSWQENLSLALKLQTQLETLCPGICRNINLRSQRFNQDLSPGSMLIEVGASGNTQEEALRTAELLAQGILSLAHGSSAS